MRPAPVVSLEPDWERGRALGGVLVGAGVGPFPESGLDEAFRFPIGLGGVGLGEEVSDAQLGAGFAVGGRAVASPVVGHDALDGDAELAVVRDHLQEEVHRRVLALVRADCRMTEAGVVIDADMQALPANAAHPVPAVAGHTMTRPLDAAELLGVEMQQFAGMGPLVTPDRSWRRARPVAAQDPTERGFRELGVLTDLGIGQALLPPPPHLLALGFGDPLGTTGRPGGPILQPG